MIRKRETIRYGVQTHVAQMHRFTESILLGVMGSLSLLVCMGFLFIIFTNSIHGMLYQPELFIKHINNTQWTQPYPVTSEMQGSADKSGAPWEETLINANQGYQLGQCVPFAGPIVGLTIGAMIGYNHSE